MKSRILLFVFILFAQLVIGQSQNAMTRVLFIYDASNSMNKEWESGTRHSVAHNLINSALDSLKDKPNLQLALRVYGHQSSYRQGQDCDDTKLEVPFGNKRVKAIQKKLKEITPKGTTPIARTLEKAGDDFPECEDCRNIIILITDGIEECDGDPCAVSRMLQKRGITLKPFIIGIGMDENFKKTFKCVGNFFDASNEKTFDNVLNIVISQALNSTTAQLNLLDIYGNPTETNVPYTFFDRFMNEDIVNYVHTMNALGNPDTIYLDPSSTYDLTVFTTPAVTKDSITLTPGKHNIIGVQAGQGTLELKKSGSISSKQAVAIVRQGGKMKTLNAQKLGTDEKYLVGTYDLEILTLPRTYINDVEIKQSHTTTIEIPPPGLVTIMKNLTGYGGIYKLEGNEATWVTNLNSAATNESVKLQPGRYRVVFRSKSSNNSKYTRVEEFSISPGESRVVNLR
ncbi:vWA domain-containing protein [Salibacter halophilus]|uniref:VWA domain-containing protein n=1 Tax=Salibacter halophilus TaxID=1803916 RepID=A0A6N6M7E1_9FLAO|nr:VWA domain-containing protein [Salibacter halophilus]KAB1064430.1 VWA domain-containing protein [Salibacter halophilus]